MLIAFVPPPVVIDKLNALIAQQKADLGMLQSVVPANGYNWQIQALRSAQGTAINLDYFPINIATLPIINGQQMTASQLMEYVRLNLNSFVDVGQPTFTPSPYVANSVSDWQNHVLGTIVSIDILLDNGSVILSGYSPTEWDFSTISEPFLHSGAHPVSGARAFGYMLSGTGATFYIRGADRINYTATELAGMLRAGTTSPSNAFQFTEGDKLWKSVEKNIAAFVNANGGNATVGIPITNRPDWVAVKAALTNNTPLATVPCP